MSADSVDDLNYAEDLLASADLLDGYCRPTCGQLDGDECEDEYCGCPCHALACVLDVVDHDATEYGPYVSAADPGDASPFGLAMVLRSMEWMAGVVR